MGFHAVGGGLEPPCIDLHAPTSSIEMLKLIGRRRADADRHRVPLVGECS
jgi:hypothetical protein